jgi:hypothetical protein
MTLSWKTNFGDVCEKSPGLKKKRLIKNHALSDFPAYISDGFSFCAFSFGARNAVNQNGKRETQTTPAPTCGKHW